ncbi:restriction endonuclease [Vibrio lentus]|uniref:restriction endonuclease n=1 Tax=Vibrio lentus TaxID=136468 RepID=UPI000C853DFE|nr:restriction endonuclease [Vibrio lentus]PMI94948.1 hypothetical protein BCU33_16165 [Vibrio lentus]
MKLLELQSFLSTLSGLHHKFEHDFMIDVFPKFASLLGYDSSSLLFDHRLKSQGGFVGIADAIIKNPEIGTTWLLIEAKGAKYPFNNSNMREKAEVQMSQYIDSDNPQYAVMLSPKILWLYCDNKKRAYDLENISLEQTTYIYDKLKAPKTWPLSMIIDNRPVSNLKDLSELQIEISNGLKLVDNAITNKQKGQSLESLTSILFSSIHGVNVKYNNLLSSSSEIDLVLEYDKTKYNQVFDEYGRYFLVECKNWNDPVGAKFVRDFRGKIEKTRVKLGFLVSKNGITGAHRGADSIREIYSCFDSNGICIVVLSRDDIVSVIEGADISSLIDKKIDRIRFDF